MAASQKTLPTLLILLCSVLDLSLKKAKCSADLLEDEFCINKPSFAVLRCDKNVDLYEYFKQW